MDNCLKCFGFTVADMCTYGSIGGQWYKIGIVLGGQRSEGGGHGGTRTPDTRRDLGTRPKDNLQ